MSAVENSAADDDFALLFERHAAGELSAAEVESLSGRLTEDAATQEAYLAWCDLHADLSLLYAGDGLDVPGGPTPRRGRPLSSAFAAAIAAAVTAVAACIMFLLTGAAERAVEEVAVVRDDAPAAAVITRRADAEVFGALLPPLGEPVEAGREYSLVRGEVGLRFAGGAELLVAAPAVWRVTGPESVELTAGDASVHAPPGSEGFVVATPLADVVDLGTRFAVSVDGLGAAEVHVLEGAAELRPVAAATREVLGERRAREISPGAPSGKATPFDAGRYREALRDRLMHYDAETDPRDGLTRLRSVTLQRDGRIETYEVADLITAEVVGFVPGSRFAVATPTADAGVPLRFLSDGLLNTGLINPAGGASYEVGDSRGLTLDFGQGVPNGPGPDLLVFELQSTAYPAAGDPFRLVALDGERKPAARVWRSFDLTLHAAESLPSGGFRLWRGPDDTPLPFDRPPSETRDAADHKPRLAFRVVATAVDLSTLGYAPETRARWLLLQAADPSNRIDPVFIAGLPASE